MKAMGPMDSTHGKLPDDVKGSEGILNVILHGTFAFAEDNSEKELTTYIPNMGTEHVYRAGTWLAESTLAQNTVFKLGGVQNGGTQKLDPAVNIIVRGPHNSMKALES